MITLNAAQARIKRQKIEQFAGSSFLPQSEILDRIPQLRNHAEQQFMFGIYDTKTRWTVLSVNFLFAAFGNKQSSLQLDVDTRKVFNHFSSGGNDFSSEFILPDGRQVWMKSAELCSLILNVMLMLEKVPCGTRLDD